MVKREGKEWKVRREGKMRWLGEKVRRDGKKRR